MNNRNNIKLGNVHFVMNYIFNNIYIRYYTFFKV